MIIRPLSTDFRDFLTMPCRQLSLQPVSQHAKTDPARQELFIVFSHFPASYSVDIKNFK